MEKSGEQKLHESTRRLYRSTRRIQQGTAMRQQMQGEEVFPDEAQSRDYIEVVQQEVSYALDEDNRRRHFQCMQGWKESYCEGT